MARIKLMTDSVCDIPVEVREHTSIQVLPFPLIVGDKEYMDGMDITPRQFYQELLSCEQIPTHAQLTPFLFTECYEKALDQGYTDLIYVSINSGASATFQNAIQAKEAFFEDHPEAKDTFRIHLVDSHNYTMGYGWAVLQADQMIAGGADVQEVLTYIQDWIDHVRVVFAPLDLRFAKKSGRISAAAAFMGEALGLKPVMTFEDGASKTLNKVRGEKAVIKSMLDLCRTERKPGSPYLVIQGVNDEQNAKLLNACSELDQEPAMVYDVGCVVSVNAGPNLVGMVYYKN